MLKFTVAFMIAYISSMDFVSAYAVTMTPQIQNLLIEKQEKIETLEQCEGKKQGWMIAGISTIGLTAVGVAGNVALANKSKNIDYAIKNENNALDAARQELDDITTKIIEMQRPEQTKEQIDETITVTVKAPEKPKNNVIITEIPNFQNLNPSVNGTGYCFRGMRDNRYRGNIDISDCGALTNNSWLIPFADGSIISGISVISQNIPNNETQGVIPNSDIQDSLTHEYNKWNSSGDAVPETNSKYACYCKMIAPHPGQWVFNSVSSGWTLTDNCAAFCSNAIQDLESFRKAIYKK